jgi:hypothetical protein
MISATDLVSFVEGLFIFDPVEEIAHDRRMTLPTLRSGLDLAIPIQVPGPPTFGRVARDAHQLCSQVVHLDPISAFAIGYLVHSMAVQFKDAVFETHTLTSGTFAPRDQELKNRSSGVADWSFGFLGSP